MFAATVKGGGRRVVTVMWRLAGCGVFGLLANGVMIPDASARQTVRWSASQALGEVSYQLLRGARLVSAPDGHMAVAWNHNGVVLALAGPGKRFGHPLRLADRSDSRPVVAIDARGEAIVAWDYSDNSVRPPREERSSGSSCCDHVRIAMVRPGGKVVSYQTVTPPGRSAEVEQVAISSDGSTVAVSYSSVSEMVARYGSWRIATTRRLVVRVASFGRRFSAAAAVGTGASSAMLRVHARRAYVIYSENGFPEEQEAVVSRHGQLISRMLVGGVAVGVTRTSFVPPARTYTVEQLASGFDAKGDAILLIDEEQLSAEYEADRRHLQTMIRGVDGRFWTDTFATAGVYYKEAFCTPSLSVAPSGLALAAWGAACEGQQISLAFGSIDGRHRGLRQTRGLALPTHADHLRAVTCALGPHDRGLIVIDMETPATRGLSKVIAITRSGSGRLGIPHQVSSELGEFDAEPQVVIDAHGRGVVIWLDQSSDLMATWFKLQ